MELIAAFLLGFFLGGVFIYNMHGSRESQPAQVEKEAGIVYDRSGKAVMGFQPPPKNPHLIGPPPRKV